jgi:hypothetical protein
MATSTILYIGFSFTDDYLNEFRAEVLKMLRPSPRLHAQFKVVLECLKLINKPDILSHFYDKNVHDDHLLDLKMASSRCDAIKANIMAIDGITASDLAQIEKYVKERVVASNRRSGDFEEIDELPPIAYAIIDSKSQQQITYFRRHEGVKMMTWKTDGWFGGLDAYLDGILRRTSRPFLWGSFLAKNVVDNNKVIITWDLDMGAEKKMVKWWLLKCLEFYSKASRHHKSLYQEPFWSRTMSHRFLLTSTRERKAAQKKFQRMTSSCLSPALKNFIALLLNIKIVWRVSYAPSGSARLLKIKRHKRAGTHSVFMTRRPLIVMSSS